MTEEARAVAEVAKTTGEIVKAAGGMVAYLARVVGSIPEDLIGLMGGDWLGHKRRRHLAVLEENTSQLLQGIAQERLSEPSPSVLIPLLQAAVDESREGLQGLWAALLANAMIDGGKRIRRDYFEAVRQMEPYDALVLDIIARRPNAHTSDNVAVNADMKFVELERIRLSIPLDDLTIAQRKLEKLDCISVAGVSSLTVFGRALLAACRVP